MNDRKSIMTLRAYRRTSTGQVTELSCRTVSLGEPYQRPITVSWPECACPRCLAATGGQHGTNGTDCRPTA